MRPLQLRSPNNGFVDAFVFIMEHSTPEATLIHHIRNIWICELEAVSSL